MEAAKQEFKTLKAKAKITYMGEFADAAASAPSRPAVATVAESSGNAGAAVFRACYGRYG